MSCEQQLCSFLSDSNFVSQIHKKVLLLTCTTMNHDQNIFSWIQVKFGPCCWWVSAGVDPGQIWIYYQQTSRTEWADLCVTFGADCVKTHISCCNGTDSLNLALIINTESWLNVGCWHAPVSRPTEQWAQSLDTITTNTVLYLKKQCARCALLLNYIAQHKKCEFSFNIYM